MNNDGLTRAGQTEGAVFRRVAWRLMPFLFICLVFNWLDRVAVSFAHLQFGADLHISDTVFGLSVGLFSAGYLLCEIPSNLVMERWGARRTLARIMIFWGLVTIGMAFVQGRIPCTSRGLCWGWLKLAFSRGYPVPDLLVPQCVPGPDYVTLYHGYSGLRHCGRTRCNVDHDPYGRGLGLAWVAVAVSAWWAAASYCRVCGFWLAGGQAGRCPLAWT